MHQIETKSLRERVINMLRVAIVNGELKPGQALIGTELANQVGVSQATMRDAISTLSVEGLVDTVAYHVPTVKAISQKDIEDLFSVRIMMEVFAIREIISKNQTTIAIRELYEVCNEMKEAAESESLTGVNWSDRKFHDTLIKHSGNQLLNVLWNTVATRVQQAISLHNHQLGDLPQIASNHLAITQVIENNDVDKATELIVAHIGVVADLIAVDWKKLNI